MSERIPEYVAMEGPGPLAGAVDRDALDDACSKALDILIEEVENVRQHVCLHPFHLDVGPEFLEAMRRLALVVDAHTAASDAVEAATPMDHVMPSAPVSADPVWRGGFETGAFAEREWLVAYARGRGWVSTAAAIELTDPVAPPAISEEATDVRA